MPIFGNGRNNSQTACICLYHRSSLSPNAGVSGLVYAGAIFSAVDTRSWTHVRGIPPDCGSPDGEDGTVPFRLIPRPLCLMQTECNKDEGRGTSVCRFIKNTNFWRLCGSIRLVQLWWSSRHSRLPHGREHQSIELPALPAGRMYSLLKADFEYILSIAIISILFYSFHVTLMPLSSDCSYKSSFYFKSKLYTVLVDFEHTKYQLSPQALHFFKFEHLTETSKTSNTFFDLLPPGLNNTTTKLHFMIWGASGVAL